MTVPDSSEVAKEKKNTYQREYRKNNPEKFRVLDKKNREKHEEKIEEKDRNYYKKNKKRLIEYQMKKRSVDPETNKIRQSTYKKFNDKKKGVCSKCGDEGRTDFHHTSYKPNKFVELCKSCHKLYHVNEKRREQRREQNGK